MGKLTSRVRERSSLTEADVAAMARLFDLYYEGAGPAQFAADLAGKTHVIELRDGDALCGFSTLCVEDVVGAVGPSRPARVIFSGDTIIDRAYWGEQALALAFCRFAGAVKAADPAVPLYWLLISKGHRTYRYLHLFAKDYTPRPGGSASPELATVAAELARRRFGDAYDAATGIVRIGDAATRLRPLWSEGPAARTASTQIAFFVRSNPGHALGDELVCLCELEPGNLRSFALQAFREGLDGR